MGWKIKEKVTSPGLVSRGSNKIEVFITFEHNRTQLFGRYGKGSRNRKRHVEPLRKNRKGKFADGRMKGKKTLWERTDSADMKLCSELWIDCWIHHIVVTNIYHLIWWVCVCNERKISISIDDSVSYDVTVM